MGLLDGDLQAIFGGTFGAFFLDATLHVVAGQEYVNGRPVAAPTWLDVPVKGMVDTYSEAYRAREGIPETDVKLIVLQHGAGGQPSVDGEITIRGTRYKIQSIAQDPAQASWEMRGRPVG